MPSASETLSAPSATADSSNETVQTPRVWLLSDSRFFVRAVPTAGSPTAAEIAAQVELALETMSPFPVAQLYHGHFWMPGATHVLVYAAYRRRFTAQETEDWNQADLVIPTFVSVVGLAQEASSTIVLSSEDTLTAVHWGESGPVPSRVLTEPIGSESTDEERAKAKDDLLRALGGSRKVIEINTPIRPIGDADDDDFEFQAGAHASKLPADQADMLDVRDKSELAARRRSRNRDIWMWRGFLSLIALLLLAGAGEFGLVGLRFWQEKRVAQLARQQPEIDKIIKSQALVTRIEKLTTDRLRPIEMLRITVSVLPASIQFKDAAVSTAASYSLEIKVKTMASQDIGLFGSALRSHPSVASVDVGAPETRSGESTSTLTIVFKPEAMRAVGKAGQP